MAWELWFARGDINYPWRLLNQHPPHQVLYAKHVVAKCLSETVEQPGRVDSHPPGHTVAIYGSPESLEERQDVVTFTGAPI